MEGPLRKQEGYKTRSQVTKTTTPTATIQRETVYNLTAMPSISVTSVDAPSHVPTNGPEPTNTLLITQVPQDFFQPIILEALRDFFSLYGEINQWAPLSCFSRIIVVYHSEDSAEQAKQNCDPLTIRPSHG